MGGRSNFQNPVSQEEAENRQDGQPKAYIGRQVYELPYPGDYRYRLVPLQSPQGRNQDLNGPQPTKLIYNPRQEVFVE